VQAIHVKETGIVDYIGFCEKLISKIVNKQNQVLFNEKVTSVASTNDEVVVKTESEIYTAKSFINCTGVYADRISETTKENQIIPFRGEYFQLNKDVEHLCKNLIYPVPNPEFPFLGVHFTRMIHGGVECGPNAVLAMGREAYNKTDFNFKDVQEMFGYSGFRSIIKKYWKTGMGEFYRSFSKRAFVKALQRLIPEIQSEHLTPIDSGIRAQAVTPEGNLVDDFLVKKRGNEVHVINAPSPAATASLSIGKYIVDNYL
jgi:L-2-hydroxyglutarate oxidase